jgi:DnaJ-class molecular chaperone
MTVIRNGKVIVNKPTVIYRPSYPYSRYVQVMCPACHGSGQKDYTCKRCGGKGKVSCPRFEKCPLCRGLGYTSKICEKCNGTKKLECSACNGKGFTGKPREYKKGGQ